MIDVWFKGRKVGTLNIVPISNNRHAVFLEKSEDTFAFSGRYKLSKVNSVLVNIKVFEIPFGKRRYTLNDTMLTRGVIDTRYLLRSHQIPEDAKCFKDIATMSTIYEWDVLMPDTQEKMEFLFDHDAFEPV